MSQGIQFTIMRRHKDLKVSENELKAIKDYYANNDTKKKDNPCPVVVDRYRYDYRKENKINSMDENQSVEVSSGCICTNLLDFNFCSNMTFLWDEFGINGYDNNHDRIISKSEAKEMAQALRYLLDGKYSQEFERILSNRWVDIFGQEYPKYYNRNRKPIDISLKKDDDGGFYFTRDDYEGDYENDNTYSYESLLSCLNAYLDADDYDYENKTDTILVVYAT